MDNADRLKSLIDGTNFKSTPDWSSQSPLMDLGNHNCAEWDKLDEERQERVIGLISAMMADVVQPLSLKQFGHTGYSAIRTLLRSKLFPEDRLKELDSLGQQARKEALSIGLTEMQAETLSQWFVSHFPEWMADCLTDLINRWQFLPRVTARQTADILATMFVEVENADTGRNN